MLQDSEDTEEIIERVAALDIDKAELVACIRVPNSDKPGRAGAGDHHLFDDDPVVAGPGRPVA